MQITTLITTITIPLLNALLVTAPSPSFAVNIAREVSPEQAQDLGMQVRSYAAGPDDFGVMLQFQTEGSLESYRNVDLAIHQDEKLLMSATLKEEEPSEGHVVVSFQAGRDQLEKISLIVETGDPPLVPFGNRIAYVLRVQNFVDLENLLDPLSGATDGERESGFTVQAPLARELGAVTVHVAPAPSFSNFHYTIRVTVPERVEQAISIRNGRPVTRADVRLVDVNSDGFLDLMIVGGADHQGQHWYKTWLFDQAAGQYRWIND